MAGNATARTMLEFQEVVLSAVDYSLFGVLIGMSLMIGLYFGFFSKQNNTNEYLFGGKTMGYVPVATSMLAGHVSGVTLLGVPSEVYQHGSAYFLIVVTLTITCLLTAHVFLPVFYGLQLSSSYEYLELRFSRRIRSVASVLFVVSLLMYIPIVIYVPALAFSQISGYGLATVLPVLCSICIVYTSLGGVKAVIWTDTVQFGFTMGSLLAIFFIGACAVGGFSKTLEIASETNRTEIFDMSPSLYVRKSFWGMTISYVFVFLAHLGVGQGSVQRYLSISTERDAKKSILLMCVGMIVMKLICGFTGLIMYAWYHGCDPLEAKIVKQSDQILPYYVMDVAGHLPGLPGMFLAGLVSCALSTMSASLNTLAGTIYDDFVNQWLPESSNKEVRATTIMKITTVIVGLLGMGLAFMVEHLGTIFEVAVGIRSVAEGPLIGLFALGMLVPRVGRRGALLGCLASLATMNLLVVGTQWRLLGGRGRHAHLPTSVEDCPFPLNETLRATAASVQGSVDEDGGDQPFFLFRISMLHYNFIGMLVTVVVGLVASYVLGEDESACVDPSLITPFAQRFLPRKKYVEVPLKEISGDKTRDGEVRKGSENDACKKDSQKVAS